MTTISAETLGQARLEQVAACEHVLGSAALLLAGRRGVEAAVLRLRVASARNEATALRHALHRAAHAP